MADDKKTENNANNANQGQNAAPAGGGGGGGGGGGLLSSLSRMSTTGGGGGGGGRGSAIGGLFGGGNKQEAPPPAPEKKDEKKEDDKDKKKKKKGKKGPTRPYQVGCTRYKCEKCCCPPGDTRIVYRPFYPAFFNDLELRSNMSANTVVAKTWSTSSIERGNARPICKCNVRANQCRIQTNVKFNRDKFVRLQSKVMSSSCSLGSISYDTVSSHGEYGDSKSTASSSPAQQGFCRMKIPKCNLCCLSNCTTYTNLGVKYTHLYKLDHCFKVPYYDPYCFINGRTVIDLPVGTVGISGDKL